MADALSAPAETTDTTIPPVTDAAPAPSADGAPAPEAGDAAATDTGGLSADLLSRLELLGGDFQPPAEPDTAPAPRTATEAARETKPAAPAGSAAPQARSRIAPKAAQADDGPMTFDRAAYEAEAIEHMGDTPFARKTASIIDALVQQVHELSARPAAAEAPSDEALNKRLTPIEQFVQAQREREWQAEQKDIHAWFDKQDGYADRYGKGDPAAHSATNKQWRGTIWGLAQGLMSDAKRRNVPLSRDEALAAAQHIKLRTPTTAGAVAAVQGKVQRQARRLSVDPVAGGGNKQAVETADQERSRRIADVDKALNTAVQQRK